MINKILAVLAVILIGLAVVINRQPAEFRITRSAAISAPASALFSQVNDFHKWDAWSPWAKMAPNAKNSFEGPAAGVGSTMRWAGNNKVGEGSMTITESHPNDRIIISLVFKKPFAATNRTEFTFQPQGKQTLMTWSMSGHNGFMGKAMGLAINCDKMVGGEFEKGLANINSIMHSKS